MRRAAFAVLLDLVPLGAELEPSVMASLTAVLSQGREGYRRQTFIIVLCELGEGFKGLWILNQHSSIRKAVSPTGRWYRWPKWPSVEGRRGLAAQHEQMGFALL